MYWHPLTSWGVLLYFNLLNKNLGSTTDHNKLNFYCHDTEVTTFTNLPMRLSRKFSHNHLKSEVKDFLNNSSIELKLVWRTYLIDKPW